MINERTGGKFFIMERNICKKFCSVNFFNSRRKKFVRWIEVFTIYSCRAQYNVTVEFEKTKKNCSNAYKIFAASQHGIHLEKKNHCILPVHI